MADYPQLFHYLNIESGKFVDADGALLGADAKPNLRLNGRYILCLTCVKADNTAAAFALTDTFSLAGDTNMDHTDSLMIYSANARFNAVADWADVDLEAGKICCQIYCNTSTDFTDKLGTSEDVSGWLEIKKYAAAVETPILQDRCKYSNLVDDGSPTPEESDPDYYTASATDSLLNLKADKTGTSDIEITDDTKGLILTDRTTATRYRFYIDNGIIGIEEA